MEQQCAQHQFEMSVDMCRTCGHDFCGECLVYSFGADQAPFCVSCALSAAGVRSSGTRPPARPKREIKRRLKEREKAAAERAKQRPEAQPVEIDWSMPTDGTGTPPAPDWLEEHLPSAGERFAF
jgi:hypothetical protein